MISRVLALALAAIVAVTAEAQQSLTVEQAVQIGLENSKMLRQSASKVLYADAKSAEVNASALPSIRASGAYTRVSDIPPFSITLPFTIPGIPNSFVLSQTILDNYSLRVGVLQPLFTGF